MRRFQKVQIKCEACGKEFETLYKWRNKIYCNRICYEKNRNGAWENHKKEIIALYKQGYGIFTLEEKFGVSHDTIWRKMKELGIPPNPNSRSLSKNMLDLSPSEDLYYILGCCYGDASPYRYAHPQCENAEMCRLELTCKDRDFADAFMESCKKIGLNPHFTTRKSETTRQGFQWKVCCDSKAFLDFWGTITDEQMINLPVQFKIPFIRGLFDSEGCFYKKGNEAKLATTKHEILFKNMIENIGFRTATYYCSNNFAKGLYSVDIRGGKYEVERFLKMIEPNIERKKWAG
jgi:hypothetical protein